MKTNLFATFALSAATCLALANAGNAASLNLDFSSTGGTLLDAQGQGTGFTTRLSGTGTALAANDPNLDINTATGKLTIRTGNNTGANQDFNGQVGLDTLEAVGIQLSSLGYTGSEDFSVSAVFDPLTPTNDFDQAGIFIGSDAQSLARAGHITFGDGQEYFSGYNTAGVDNNGRFFGFGFNGADGMTVTISRVGGDWQFFVDGLAWHPNTAGDGAGTPVDPTGFNGSPDLNSLSDLTVGVFAINVVNTVSETVSLDSFSVNVPVPGDACGDGTVDIECDFPLISDNLFNTVPAGTLGDVTLDGVVNYADFRLWKNNYVPEGSASGSIVGGVPEPSGIVLAVFALLGIAIRRRVS
jgi:hypothetical protein